LSLEPLFADEAFYCPLCDDSDDESDYLRGVFPKERERWLANMVTHYRHSHVMYYNNGVDYVASYHNYDEFKHLANERAKRQIIRKCLAFLLAHGFTSQDFAALKGTDQKTLELAQRQLDSRNAPAQAPLILDPS
jgi:hypothetical protein